MKKVKITVVETTFNKKLAEKYAAEDLTPCTYNTVGQVFISNGWQKPAGLCDNAWKSMQEYVFTLAHGGANFYDGWLKNPKMAMTACNDGFRPVIFKIEVLDEDSNIFEG